MYKFNHKLIHYILAVTTKKNSDSFKTINLSKCCLFFLSMYDEFEDRISYLDVILLQILLLKVYINIFRIFVNIC